MSGRPAVRGPAERLIAETLFACPASPRADEIFSGWRDRSLEVQLQILALHRPMRHWRPRIRWRGLKNVALALRGGSGAILWTSDFVYSSLVTKIAFHEAGFAITKLSRPEHGFSTSPFGIRFLNPSWTRIEDRFMAGRVVIAGGDTKGALEALRRRLAAGRLICITASDTARRCAEVGFLGRRLRLATGPLHLSRTSGAPLLPVFTIRGDDGAYEICVGQPLEPGEGREADYGAAAQAYATMLEPFVRTHPDQWSGWMSMARAVAGEKP